MKAQLCPVCEGRGEVTSNFYGYGASTSASPVKCRACDGQGYLLLSEDRGYVPQPCPQYRLSPPWSAYTITYIYG